MVDYQTISIVLTGIGMIIALTYYALQIRNQNKTRQAQLFMNLQQRFDNPQLMGTLIRSRDYEEISFDEWYNTYGPNGDRETYTDWVCLQNAIQGIGILVKSKQVRPEMVEELMGSIIALNWERSGPIITEMRERLGRKGAWREVENLYHELKKIPYQ